MLVIARGPSVNDYARNELKACAKLNFTLSVNSACLDFPSDIVVAGDCRWIQDNLQSLLKLNKPIITRKWEALYGLGVDLIELPSEVVEVARLSGMIAAVVADRMARIMNTMAFAIGLDGGTVHYDPTSSAGTYIAGDFEYARLGCKNMVNMSHKSTIKCWPKYCRLPDNDRPTPEHREEAIKFIRIAAAGMFGDIK